MEKGGGNEVFGASLSPAVLKCATWCQSFFTAVQRINQTQATYEHLPRRKVQEQGR